RPMPRHKTTLKNIYTPTRMIQKHGINLINDRLGVFNTAKNQEYLRKPEWLKIKINTSDSYKKLKKFMREKRLNTVCEEARCPNLHECWSGRKTATFMIIGDTCIRGCRFSAVIVCWHMELECSDIVIVSDFIQ